MRSELTGQFILLCFAVVLIYWIVAAFAAKRTVERYGGEWRVVVLAIVIGAFIRFLRIGTGVGPTVVLPHTFAIQLIADAVTVCRLVLTLWARYLLGGNWSLNVVLKEQHELIEQGPYAYIRHPIYSGVELMLLGLVIFWGTLNGLFLFGLSFLGLWGKARLEEKLLTKHFPEAYPAYKRRTKTLIPFVL